MLLQFLQFRKGINKSFIVAAFMTCRSTGHIVHEVLHPRPRLQTRSLLDILWNMRSSKACQYPSQHPNKGQPVRPELWNLIRKS